MKHTYIHNVYAYILVCMWEAWKRFKEGYLGGAGKRKGRRKSDIILF